MRIVHEIYGDVQVACGGDPYQKRADEKTARGMCVDLTVSVRADPQFPFIPDDAIYIEGDARLVLAALENAAAAVRRMASELVEAGELDPNWANPPASET